MVVMAIVLVLAGAGVAYVGAYIPRRQVEGAAFQLVQDLRDLQSQAVFKRCVMGIKFRADATHNEYEFETKPGGFDSNSPNFGSTMKRALTKAAGFPVYVLGTSDPGTSVYLAASARMPSANEVRLYFSPFGVPSTDPPGTAIADPWAAVFLTTPSGVVIEVRVSPVIGRTSMVWQ
jgi:hypothetical protein